MAIPKILSSLKSPTLFAFLHKQKSNFDFPVLTDDWTVIFRFQIQFFKFKKDLLSVQNKIQGAINIIIQNTLNTMYI